MSGSGTIAHGTAVAIDNHGVLLLGRSGAGKSDLALRLIDRGALLISDDAVLLEVTGTCPVLQAAPNIAAKLHIGGSAIFDVAACSSAPLRLLVDLESRGERLPCDNITRSLCGFDIPIVHIAPFEASAPIKLEYALRSVVDAGRRPVAQGPSATDKARTI